MAAKVLKNDQHFGHLIVQVMKSNPEDICQIDAVTGEKETNASVLSRSVRLATCLRKLGAQPGNVLAINGKNHLDLHIPYYAALFNGLPICGVDNSFKYDEVKNIFNVILPKVAFCDRNAYEMFKKVVTDLNLETTVIRFGDGTNSMNEFMSKCDDQSIEEFRVAEFDVDKIYLWLATTSGTTGNAKVAALKQAPIIAKFKSSYQALLKLTHEPRLTKRGVNTFNVGPIHWLTGLINALALPLMGHCKVQTSGPANADHYADIINQYKPVSLLTGPTTVSTLLKHRKHCDFSCFQIIQVSGAKLRSEVYDEMCSRLSEGSFIINLYGQTETGGAILYSDPFGPRDALVMPTSDYELKITDPDTGLEVIEPMARGELWCRGPGFTEYYRNPMETKKAVTEDGWYKTGDIFCKDEAGYFYYVERVKMLIKYKNYHMVPAELEELIRSHPSVHDVVVTSIPHDEDGEHPVACVVKEKGANISAREIADLIADKLSDNKRLRGGVIFLDEIPITSTGKIAVRKLKQIVLNSRREL
ncbi:unnamed protein product [Diatraea saccharalis]|uniref:Luciferin 4-monooxygenase n=1 Tax=Diatraea saccharalis TaxID=40085 RepID=A0A9N9WHR8_9NEOP|nr:unnamed protein product [Diatraea saccharalis]